MFLVKLKTWNMLHRAYRTIMVLSSILVSTQFFNMINIVKRAECLNDFPVGLVLFQLCAENGESDGEHAQTRTNISLIRFNIVDSQTKLTVREENRRVPVPNGRVCLPNQLFAKLVLYTDDLCAVCVNRYCQKFILNRCFHKRTSLQIGSVFVKSKASQ